MIQYVSYKCYVFLLKNSTFTLSEPLEYFIFSNERDMSSEDWQFFALEKILLLTKSRANRLSNFCSQQDHL